MRLSARVLGSRYNLSAQEMNYLLREKGFLSGEPGDYTVTEKGKPYATEQDFHRGTGGYACYNRDWTTRSWDETIEDELNITDEDIDNARAAVAERKRNQWDQIKAKRAAADAAFLAHQNGEQADIEDAGSTKDSKDRLADALIVGGVLITLYGVYKITPHIKKWWSTFGVSKLRKPKNKLPCPVCKKEMAYNKKSGKWECCHCDFSASEEALRDGVIDTEEFRAACISCGVDPDSFTQDDLKKPQRKLK